MNLTPNDIRNYEFKGQLRGYEKDAVDEFQEEAANALEATRQENLKLSMEVESLKNQLTGLKQFEDTIKSAAIDARRNADMTVSNAKQEAELIVSRANAEAEKAVESRSQEIADIEGQLNKLELTKRSYVSKLKGMISSHLELVEEILRSELSKEREESQSRVRSNQRFARQLPLPLPGRNRSGPKRLTLRVRLFRQRPRISPIKQPRMYRLVPLKNLPTMQSRLIRNSQKRYRTIPVKFLQRRLSMRRLHRLVTGNQPVRGNQSAAALPKPTPALRISRKGSLASRTKRKPTLPTKSCNAPRPVGSRRMGNRCRPRISSNPLMRSLPSLRKKWTRPRKTDLPTHVCKRPA